MEKKKRISQKMLMAFINSIANVVPTDPDIAPGNDVPDSYVSKVDGSYLTFVGLEKDLKHLLRRDITEQVTHGTGFNPVEQKWYGWSHRAIYGFGVGSTCKKGNIHYHPANLVDFIEDCIQFWSDEHHLDVKAFPAMEEGASGARVEWCYDNKVKNESLRGTIDGSFMHAPEDWGRGEWTAETLEDAKLMAVDFMKGCS